MNGVMIALGSGQCDLKLLDGYSYLIKKIMNMFIFDQNEIHLLFDLENLKFSPQCNVYI